MDAIDPGVGLISLRERIKYAKHLKKNFELLKQLAELLYNRRNSLKEEINRELMTGKMPMIELRIWLEEIEEISFKVDPIVHAVEEFELQKRCSTGHCFDIPLRMKLGKDVVSLFNEISSFLEKDMFEKGPSETVEKAEIIYKQRKKKKKNAKANEVGVRERGNKPALGKEAASRKESMETKKAEIASLSDLAMSRFEGEKMSITEIKADQMPKLHQARHSKMDLQKEKDSPSIEDEQRKVKAKMKQYEMPSRSDAEGEPVIEAEEMLTPATEGETISAPESEALANTAPGEGGKMTSEITEEDEYVPEVMPTRIMLPVEESESGMIPAEGREDKMTPVIKDKCLPLFGWKMKSSRKEKNTPRKEDVPRKDKMEDEMPSWLDIEDRVIDIEGEVESMSRIPKERVESRIIPAARTEGEFYKETDFVHVNLSLPREVEMSHMPEIETETVPSEPGGEYLITPSLRQMEPPKEQEEKGEFLKDYPLYRLLESSESNIFPFPEGHQSLSRSAMGLTQPPEQEEWEQAGSIFLMDNKLSWLPENPKCHKLLRLFLQRNYHLRIIPNSFFEYMPSLQVLDLSYTRIRSLPSSISKLSSLRGLVLHGCERLAMLPSELGELKHLEMLDLSGTKINHLPNDIQKLTCLHHLEVSFYWYDNRDKTLKLPPKLISQGIISKLTGLRNLSIVVDPEDQRWNEIIQFMTEEVGSLEELTTLQLYFPEVKLLELFIQMSPSWKNGYLSRFKFTVGYDIKRLIARVPIETELKYELQDCCLRFVNGIGVEVPKAVVDVLTRTTALYLDSHHLVRSLSDFGVGNLKGLALCIVRECPAIETILERVEGQGLALLPMLECLNIHYLWNLRSIWKGSMPPGSLCRLKSLTLHTCPNLGYVFEEHMLQHLSSLEELVVKDCKSVEGIILGEEAIEPDFVLPRLKRLSLHYLPKLVSIWKGVWKSLEYVCFYNCPNLKNLFIDTRLRYTILEIKGEKDWWDALEWQDDTVLLQLQRLFVPIYDDDL